MNEWSTSPRDYQMCELWLDPEGALSSLTRLGYLGMGYKDIHKKQSKDFWGVSLKEPSNMPWWGWKNSPHGDVMVDHEGCRLGEWNGQTELGEEPN